MLRQLWLHATVAELIVNTTAGLVASVWHRLGRQHANASHCGFPINVTITSSSQNAHNKSIAEKAALEVYQYIASGGENNGLNYINYGYVLPC